jgi:hypothetical protein
MTITRKSSTSLRLLLWQRSRLMRTTSLLAMLVVTTSALVAPRSRVRSETV